MTVDVCLMIAALALYADGAADAPSKADSDPVVVTIPDRKFPLLEPDWTVPLGAREFVYAASGDGRTVYMAEEIDTIDMGRLASHHVLAVTLIPAALLWLILIWRMWRVGRLRRAAGETYCRKCNYNLRGAAAARCPECGVALTPRKRVAGRGPGRRRILVGLATLLLAAGVAIAQWRHNDVAVWLDDAVTWDWPWLYELAERNDVPWILECRDQVLVLKAVDLDTRTTRFRVDFGIEQTPVWCLFAVNRSSCLW